MNKYYPNLFKSRYLNLSGSDWINKIDAEDKKAFIELGLKHAEYGKLGGAKRAKTGKRGSNGKFIKN